MFTLFMVMLKDDLFCLLKKLVFIWFFFSQVKIPLPFWVVVVVVGEGGGSIYSTPRRGRGSMNLDGIQQGEGGGSRKRNFEGDV